MTVTTALREGYPVIGLYSETAAKLFGSAIYLDRFGNEVEVTCVSANPECVKTYLWEDTIMVSVSLDKWVRVGKPAQSRQMYYEPFIYIPTMNVTILNYIK